MNTESKHKIILFDGVCNLCNTSVNFVIKNDKKGVFRFAPIQTDFGETTLKKYHINTKDTDSIILIDEDNIISNQLRRYILLKNFLEPTLFYFVL